MAAWRTTLDIRDIVIPDIQDPAKSSLDLNCPLPVDSKPPEMGASNSVVAQAGRGWMSTGCSVRWRGSLPPCPVAVLLPARHMRPQGD